jgi:hypothetical protein
MVTRCTTINDIGHCRMCVHGEQGAMGQICSCLSLHSDGRAATTEAPLHGTLRHRYDIPREPSSQHGRQTSNRSFTL